MSVTAGLQKQVVRLDQIDFSNNRFKLSRNIIPEKLARSIAVHGVIEEPILLGGEAPFIIMTGHNRLNALKNNGISETVCHMSPVVDTGILLNNAILKNQHGGIGPIGKLRLLFIMSEFDGTIDGRMAELAGSEFSVPDFFLRDHDLLKKVLLLPSVLLDYADIRDTGFKTIRDLVLLPTGAREILSGWISAVHMRVNVFREMVDLLYDLSKTEGALDPLREIEPGVDDDPRGRENRLVAAVRRHRYPDYSAKMEQADACISELNAGAIGVDFPQYFEGDAVGLSFTVSKREGAGVLRKKFDRLDISVVQRLLDLL